jgi:hypothetical protein
VEIQIRLNDLHAGQSAIVNHPARYHVLCCGRRFGKTALAVDLLVNAALDGESWAYCAPKYDMVTEVWSQLKHILAPVIRAKNENLYRLELITGGVIRIWGLYADISMRGQAYNGVIIDEAAYIKNLLDIWQKAITPTLTDYRGRAYFLSTPNGHNGFWSLYNQANDPLFPDWQCWHYPTVDNPHIDPDEVDLQRKQLPERAFRQEYLAEFIDDAGGVFRGVNDVCILPQRLPYAGDFVMGVDWAKSHDFTVISMVDRDTRQQVFMDRFNQVSWEVQRGRLIEIYRQWNPSVIYAESNSIGEPNIEALQREGIPVRPFETTALSKTPLIDALSLAIERKELTLLRNEVQRTELQAYQMERLPSGKYRYGSPDGGHDDTVMALALAWHGCYTSKRLLLWE